MSIEIADITFSRNSSYKQINELLELLRNDPRFYVEESPDVGLATINVTDHAEQETVFTGYRTGSEDEEDGKEESGEKEEPVEEEEKEEEEKHKSICKFCEKEFTGTHKEVDEKLDLHIREKHEDKLRYTCDDCGKRFTAPVTANPKHHDCRPEEAEDFPRSLNQIDPKYNHYICIDCKSVYDSKTDAKTHRRETGHDNWTVAKFVPEKWRTSETIAKVIKRNT